MTTESNTKELSIEIVKKITFKSIAGVPSATQIKEAIKADATELPQKMRVVGMATSKRTQVNEDTGETYTGLAGDFIAFNPNKPDEKYQSGTAYLPAIAFDLIMGRVNGLAPGEHVEFAIEIGLRLPKEGEKSPVGYIYTVKPLIKPAQESPMLKLLVAASGE